MIDDLKEFHEKFGLRPGLSRPHIPSDPDLLAFRLAFLKEELAEIEAAVAAEDLPGLADGLVDLVYVALGTAHLLSLPWEELWAAVHEANMKKERVARALGPNSSRGGVYDVVKPPGWEAPNIHKVLRQRGWGDGV